MKLSALSHSKDPQKVSIKHPVTNEDTGIVIEVISTDSKEWQLAIRKLAKQSKDVKPSDDISELALLDEIERGMNATAELLTSVTIGWEGIDDDNGKPIKFTKENAVEVYKQSSVIRNQVDKFISNEANFFTKA